VSKFKKCKEKQINEIFSQISLELENSSSDFNFRTFCDLKRLSSSRDFFHAKTNPGKTSQVNR
jgi:hypothetical protein